MSEQNRAHDVESGVDVGFATTGLYLPDRDRDSTGGVGLPEPELRIPDGQVLTGQQLCAKVDAATTTPAVAKLPMDKYSALRDQPGKPATFPAAQSPVWRTHPDDGYLILRNMLPDRGFGHAVQDTETPGDEKSVIGSHLPDGSYTSKAAFESTGCPLRAADGSL
ncbi:hypothetical protein ACWEP5_07080 [Nocardia niigatensis]